MGNNAFFSLTWEKYFPREAVYPESVFSFPSGQSFFLRGMTRYCMGVTR